MLLCVKKFREYMKKLPFFIWLLAAACGQIIPTPNDFPTPPATIIVEIPDYTIMPTFVPRPQFITSDDMVDAKSFFLLVKINMMAGNDQGVAERVLYPINVKVDGQSMKISTPAEFVRNYQQIFNDTVVSALTETNEDNLLSSADGIRVGNGELWFNLFCMDAACTQKEFLITQINN